MNDTSTYLPLYLPGWIIMRRTSGNYFSNWKNSREKGSLADEAGPIRNSLQLFWLVSSKDSKQGYEGH